MKRKKYCLRVFAFLACGFFVCSVDVEAKPRTIRKGGIEYVYDKENNRNRFKETDGLDYVEDGENGDGFSQNDMYVMPESEHFQFTKERYAYFDEETGKKIKQKIHALGVGWTLSENENKIDKTNFFLPGEKIKGEDLLRLAKENGAVTYGGVSRRFGKKSDEWLEKYERGEFYGNWNGDIFEKESLKNIKYGDNSGVGTPYINQYVVYDYGPVIEAYDRYYTLEEAQSGFITEDKLLNAAKATDEELKSEVNLEGRLEKYENDWCGTSFVVWDYQAEEFTDLNGPAVISVTYRAEDSVGNVTKKMVKVHIVDGHDTIIDGHDIGVDPDKGEVRFISEKYLDTLDEDSVWVNNPEYAALLKETVAIKRVNPERSEAPDMLKAFGDKYTVAIPGTGTWTKEPKYVWNFTHEQVEEVKEFIEEHGPSNFVEEDALNKFLNEFDKCRVK